MTRFPSQRRFRRLAEKRRLGRKRPQTGQDLGSFWGPFRPLFPSPQWRFLTIFIKISILWLNHSPAFGEKTQVHRGGGSRGGASSLGDGVGRPSDLGALWDPHGHPAQGAGTSPARAGPTASSSLARAGAATPETFVFGQPRRPGSARSRAAPRCGDDRPPQPGPGPGATSRPRRGGTAVASTFSLSSPGSVKPDSPRGA